MAAAGNCDDSWRVRSEMPFSIYPAWVPLPQQPNGIVANHHCHDRGARPQRRRCQITRANNERHPVPPNNAMVVGVGTTTRRTVCDACNDQGVHMANTDRWVIPFVGAPQVNWNYLRGAEAIFRDDGLNRAAERWAGIPPQDLELGAHYLGKLCELCENTEIERYWERRFAGTRRQTEARARNTCKCEAFLEKRLCYQDRVNYLFDVQAKSGRNAAWPFPFPNNFLEWLWFDDTAGVGRAKWASSPASRAIIAARRHTPGVVPALEHNACRCGRDIPRRAAPGVPQPRTPSPVAMCTACDGIIVDVNHARVTGWANTPATPHMLPVEEQGNLTLWREVEHS